MFPRVTSEMVRSRTVELAMIAGRTSIEIRQRDYEQAKRELTGETDFDRQHAVIHSGHRCHAQPDEAPWSGNHRHSIARTEGGAVFNEDHGLLRVPIG